MVARIYYVGGHCADRACVIQSLMIAYAVGFFIFAMSILCGVRPFTQRTPRYDTDDDNAAGNNNNRRRNKWTKECRDNRCLWVTYRFLVSVLLPSLLWPVLFVVIGLYVAVA